MRINVYHHELPHMIGRAEVVKTVADTHITFYGVRFYTEPPLMHHDDDDDSAAITVWGIAHRDERGHTAELRQLFEAGLRVCDEIDARTAGQQETDQ